MTIEELLAAARDGSARAAGRLLSLVESPRRDEVLAVLGDQTARVIGVTGPPGAGKSTTIAVLVAAYREQGKRVAVLAVDPSSPYSGGALLGDRIRMAAHINDPDVLIRSVATRGHLGGLAAAVPAAVRVLAALSYDVILVETVGVGQSEIEVAAVADPAVVILNPGAGDAIQAAKAGLLEVADIVAINKADREGADQTVRDLHAETARRSSRSSPRRTWASPSWSRRSTRTTARTIPNGELRERALRSFPWLRPLFESTPGSRPLPREWPRGAWTCIPRRSRCSMTLFVRSNENENVLSRSVKSCCTIS